ncbi:hypothetical protein [Steroidobacter agaridevorans]|uniref:hypothetical protein n=1 Tax=Steroidobacter agaridevorans TaxID=2695856 RepID=UPI0013252426|nr:hypothetical protein [Steroidobacter agaridevorans]GFE85377.1 hypothetical protein GCM10011488_03310 [Steroidobacter agaridevorans]
MRAPKLLRNILASLGLLIAADASALTGTIQQLYFSGQGNFPVRVYLQGVADPCGNGGSEFVFIAPVYDNNGRETANYNVYAAALMMAKAQGSTVAMSVVPDSANPTICRLVEFAVI